MPKGFNKESAKWVDGIKEREGYDGMKRGQAEEKERRGRGKREERDEREEREEKKVVSKWKRRKGR